MAALWFAAFFLIPSTPDGLVAKEMMIRITTYLLIGLVIYLAITLHLLRKTLKKLLTEMKEEQIALLEEQIAQLEEHVTIVSSSLDTIEACGGGSARCMMAEIFLPRE